MDGIYYYKLVSGYDNDVTKNCKLTVNEIDSNFFNLKSVDIKEFHLEDYNLVLTRNNGERLVVDIKPLFDAIVFPDPEEIDFPKLNVEYDKEQGVIIISHGDKEDERFVIEGLITEDNLDTAVNLRTRVIHDGTLKGNGTLTSPLGLSSVEKTGYYKPAIKIIDTTHGESLPEDKTVGDRYLTFEKKSEYGYLYQFDAVKKIQESLEDTEWRVPSKEDWDKMLDCIEPCEFQNHESTDCHVELGKHAGNKLKSVNEWEEFTGTTINTDGLEESAPSQDERDMYGFSVLPSGRGRYGEDFGKAAGFWTTTHVCDDENQDIYAKVFQYDKTGVYQEAPCPDEYYSIRLVKDFSNFHPCDSGECECCGSNAYQFEDINGITYPTTIIPCAQQVWTTANYSEYIEGFTMEPQTDKDIFYGAYYINEWNGCTWEKKSLNEGDTIVLNEGPNGEENGEFRVFTSEENGDQYLVNTDDAVVERVVNILRPEFDDKLAQEKRELQEADQALDDKILTLDAKVDDIENELTSRINEVESNLADEIERATSAENALDEKINDVKSDLDQEKQDRQEADENIIGKLIESGEYNLLDGKLILTRNNGETVEVLLNSNYGEF